MMGAMSRHSVLRALGLAALVSSLSLPRSALAEPSNPRVAQTVPLRVDASGEAMRVDGALREWRGASFAELGGAEGSSVRYALASDAQGLYLGAEVDDDVAVRKGSVRDALVLTFDDGDTKPRRRELWLYPGESGRTKASAAVGVGGATQPEPRVRVVEGPRSGGSGYVLEAFIPFEALFGRELWEASRAALRLEDADGKGPVQRSATASGASLPRLVLGVGEPDFFGSFGSARGKPGVAPSRELRANLAGDGRPERAALIDGAIVVYGSGVQQGKAFVFFELPVASGAAVEELSPVDFDADGTSELVVRYRQKNEHGVRSVYAVLSVGDTQIRRVFAAEVKKIVGPDSVEAGLALEAGGRGAKRLRLYALKEPKQKQSAFEERPAEDVVPLPVPWGPVRSRTYSFEGGHFHELPELAQVDASPAPSPTPSSSAAPRPAQPAPLPVAVAAGASELLAHFKRAAGLPAELTPRLELSGNLVGSARAERCYLLGKNLVVLGPDVGDGLAYVAYGLPVEPSAVGELKLGDVTGDGVAELLVRVTQPLSGADGVERDVLLVLSVDGQRFTRLLAVEVARRQGSRSIQNVVRAGAGRLTLEAGEARGWDASSYPFTDEAAGGVEALLLPWKARTLGYAPRGERLVPVR
jgi:hypothetical protein